jgi:hypothetical protein
MTDLSPVYAMTNPYRDMCAELVEQVQRAISNHGLCLDASDALMHRARALMAQPEPVLQPIALTEREPEYDSFCWFGHWTGNCWIWKWGTGPHHWQTHWLPANALPTDEEIMELMPQQMRDDPANAARALAGFDRANVKAAGAMRIILNRYAVNHARAVLAKWGLQ